MNLVYIQNILSLVAESIMVIAALVGILKFKKVWQKVGSIMVLSVMLCSLGLGFYLQPNVGSVEADFYLSVYKPVVVNIDGTQSDRFLVDSNYRVLASATYPLDTRFTVVVTNMKTLERNEYIISDVYNGKQIGTMSSGKYKLELYIDSELCATEVIELTTQNLDEAGEWKHRIYVFDEYYDKAVQKEVVLGSAAYCAVEFPAFGIYSDDVYEHAIFDTAFTDENGTLEGEFYFLPGRYYLVNAVSPTEMERIIIDVR